jgi:hypothetical protein
VFTAISFHFVTSFAACVTRRNGKRDDDDADHHKDSPHVAPLGSMSEGSSDPHTLKSMQALFAVSSQRI